MSANMPCILLCADAAAEIGDVRRALERAQYSIVEHSLATSDPPELTAYQAVVVDASRNSLECLALCRRLRGRINDGYLPTLFITSDPGPAARLASLESGADAFLLRPFDSAEL